MGANIVSIPYSRTTKVQSDKNITENLGRYIFTNIEQPFLLFENFISYVNSQKEIL